MVLGKQSAVYPAVAGISVQAVAASGPAAPEPGQSRPADQRFHQLALPFEERGAKGEEYAAFSYFSAALGTHDLACFVTKK